MNKFTHILLFCIKLVYFVAHEADAKIYDCFLFYNEIEILNIRLHEMYDHVDKFVLVESEETFRGKPKPLYYQENKHLFEKFADKIIHVVVEGHFESDNKSDYWKVWDREYFQRNQIMRGLTDCGDDDLIIISDVDEILRSSAIQEIYDMIHSIPAHLNYKWIVCEQTYYKYFFNRYYPKEMPWIGTTAVFYKDLKNYAPPQYFRRIRRGNRPFVVKNAGWHFSYMGGYNNVVNKLAAFSHQEWDIPENRERNNMRKEIESLPLVVIDESFPRIIYENRQEYIDKGFIDAMSMDPGSAS